MIKLFIKLWVPNYENVHDPSVREQYGVLSGVIGLLCNLLLFGLKLIIGLAMNSIAILSDAFNNLTDMGSSLITLIGAKLSNKTADEEHPYGHGRYEYIASLIIAFIILLVGVELLKSAFGKIINPEVVEFKWTLIIILAVSTLVKVWMFSYNRYIGKKIDSKVNLATATDSLNDVLATGAVILSAVIGFYFDFPIDGFAGLVVSILILKTGFDVAKDTVNVLLGMSPNGETVARIHEIILEDGYVGGIHDLKVHDYGPGRKIASVHVEVSDQTNLIQAHHEIDKIERRILSEMGIDIVIHVDPVSNGGMSPIQ